MLVYQRVSTISTTKSWFFASKSWGVLRVTPFFTAPCPTGGLSVRCMWMNRLGAGKAFQCGANRAGNVLDFADVLRICPLNTKHQTKSEKTNKNKATKDATDGMKMCTKK